MQKRITVIKESKTGKNLKFKDNKMGKIMSRPEFVDKIEEGKYPKYHVRKINGIKTTVSNPDDSVNNNLD